MDRSSIVRWVLTAAIIVGGYMFFFNRSTGESSQRLPPETYLSAPGFVPDPIDGVVGGAAASPPPEGETCTIRGRRFEADLSTRGAGVTHFRLTDPRTRTETGSAMTPGTCRPRRTSSAGGISARCFASPVRLPPPDDQV